MPNRSLEKLYVTLYNSRRNEAEAITRLCRAQTLFGKYYVRSLKLQDAIDAKLKESEAVADRLLERYDD